MLLFVVQRRNVESYLFAFVSICVNLAYYSLHGVNLFSWAALPAWLISIALPAAIARYSHLIVDAGIAQDDTDETPQEDAQDVDTVADAAPQIDATTTAQTAPTQARKRKATKRKPQKLTPEQRRAQILESGMDDAATIAAQFKISLRTAQADIAATRDAMLSTNGGAK